MRDELQEVLRELEAAVWAPLTLHWGWELEDDFASLRRLCDLLQGIAEQGGDYFYRGPFAKAVAERMARSEDSVQKLWVRALATLRRMLGEVR